MFGGNLSSTPVGFDPKKSIWGQKNLIKAYYVYVVTLRTLVSLRKILQIRVLKRNGLTHSYFPLEELTNTYILYCYGKFVNESSTGSLQTCASEINWGDPSMTTRNNSRETFDVQHTGVFNEAVNQHLKRMTQMAPKESKKLRVILKPAKNCLENIEQYENCLENILPYIIMIADLKTLILELGVDRSQLLLIKDIMRDGLVKMEYLSLSLYCLRENDQHSIIGPEFENLISTISSKKLSSLKLSLSGFGNLEGAWDYCLNQCVSIRRLEIYLENTSFHIINNDKGSKNGLFLEKMLLTNLPNLEKLQTLSLIMNDPNKSNYLNKENCLTLGGLINTYLVQLEALEIESYCEKERTSKEGIDFSVPCGLFKKKNGTLNSVKLYLWKVEFLNKDLEQFYKELRNLNKLEEFHFVYKHRNEFSENETTAEQMFNTFSELKELSELTLCLCPEYKAFFYLNKLVEVRKDNLLSLNIHLRTLPNVAVEKMKAKLQETGKDFLLYSIHQVHQNIQSLELNIKAIEMNQSRVKILFKLLWSLKHLKEVSIYLRVAERSLSSAILEKLMILVGNMKTLSAGREEAKIKKLDIRATPNSLKLLFDVNLLENKKLIQKEVKSLFFRVEDGNFQMKEIYQLIRKERVYLEFLSITAPDISSCPEDITPLLAELGGSTGILSDLKLDIAYFEEFAISELARVIANTIKVNIGIPTTFQGDDIVSLLFKIFGMKQLLGLKVKPSTLRMITNPGFKGFYLHFNSLLLNKQRCLLCGYVLKFRKRDIKLRNQIWGEILLDYLVSPNEFEERIMHEFGLSLFLE